MAAHRIRLLLQQQKIDTEQYETTTLNLFRTIPETDLKPLIEKTAALGGTRAAAESVIRAYKNKTTQSTLPEPETQSNTHQSEEPDMIIQSGNNAVKEHAPSVVLSSVSLPTEKTEDALQQPKIPPSRKQESLQPVPSFSQAEQKQTHSHSEPKSNNAAIHEEKMPVADKLISSKFVFGEITAYIKAVQNTIATLESHEVKLLEQAKIEAAYDIIALLHTDTEA